MPTKSRLCTFSAAIVLILAAALHASAFRAEEVKVTNRTAHVKLAGTLTTPDSSTPKALIVTATGSGAQDRDEEIMGHRPFKAIAEALADNGYGVLRMDDRGAGQSDKATGNETTADFAGDVLAGVRYLATQYPGVPVGVLGHSEGGLIAEMLAPDSAVSFIITMGAPAFRGDSIVMDQCRALITAAMPDQLYAKLAQQRSVLNTAMSPMPRPMRKAMLRSEVLAAYPPEAAKIPEVSQAIDKEVDAMTSAWYTEFLKFDPTDAVKAVNVPWLALNGSLDTQVLPHNLDRIKQLNAAADTVLLDGINHIMLPATTGLVTEYATLPGDIDSGVVDTIVAWLKNRY